MLNGRRRNFAAGPLFLDFTPSPPAVVAPPFIVALSERVGALVNEAEGIISRCLWLISRSHHRYISNFYYSHYARQRDATRRDAGSSRQQSTEVNADDAVAAASTEEIDRAILELQCVRDVLRREDEQVNRDLAGYASLNQHLMTGMKIIAENLKQRRTRAPCNAINSPTYR